MLQCIKDDSDAENKPHFTKITHNDSDSIMKQLILLMDYNWKNKDNA